MYTVYIIILTLASGLVTTATLLLNTLLGPSSSLCDKLLLEEPPLCITATVAYKERQTERE